MWAMLCLAPILRSGRGLVKCLEIGQGPVGKSEQEQSYSGTASAGGILFGHAVRLPLIPAHFGSPPNSGSAS